MQIKPLRKELITYLKKRNLFTKWIKRSTLFVENHKHPSLKFELLEPKWRGIFAFRLDRKYRALCFVDKNGEMEVFQITNHYK